MLESLTIDDFAGRVGERFLLTIEDGTLECALDGCERLGGAALGRIPFSLVFVGPREPLLPQRIYPCRHEELGDFELFLVPIDSDSSGTRYEAVFT